MRAAKFQLENYFVEELFFKLLPNSEPDSKNLPKLVPGDLNVEVGTGDHKENEFKKLCRLNIGVKKEARKKFPYDFRISLVGFFEIDPGCEEQETSLLLRTNAPSMLFTAARELLLLVTGRARHFPIMLPTVAFLPPAAKQIAEGSAAKPTRARTKPASKPAIKARPPKSIKKK
jgi:preprotein translocase subunit SecB